MYPASSFFYSDAKSKNRLPETRLTVPASSLACGWVELRGSRWAAWVLYLLQAALRPPPHSLCSLHELVKHEENGLVFEDSEELAAQLQVACLLPHCGLQGFGDSLFLQLGGWPWAVSG